MKLVILGATGNIGSEVLAQALAADHQVTALVRDASRLTARPGLTVQETPLTDVPAMTSAFTGADVVISAIGGKPKDHLLTQLLPGIGQAVDAAGTRLVLVSAFGAGDSAAKASWFARLLYRTVVKPVFEDKAVSEAAVLPALSAPWTVVMPVNLKKGDAAPRQTVIPLDAVSSVPGLPTLPFANAAAGILQVAADDSLNHQRVLLTTAGGYKQA